MLCLPWRSWGFCRNLKDNNEDLICNFSFFIYLGRYWCNNIVGCIHLIKRTNTVRVQNTLL
jgi:hypothetical protein